MAAIRLDQRRRRASSAAPPKRGSRVLVATDGSEATISAARTALEMLGPGHDVEVVAAAGIDDSAILAMLPGPGLMPSAHPADDRSETTYRALLDATTSALGVMRPGRMLHGAPGPTICSHAAETDVDLIVVHADGTGFVKRALVGSVSRYVVDHAPCAVLVAR